MKLRTVRQTEAVSSRKEAEEVLEIIYIDTPTPDVFQGSDSSRTNPFFVSLEKASPPALVDTLDRSLSRHDDQGDGARQGFTDCPASRSGSPADLDTPNDGPASDPSWSPSNLYTITNPDYSPASPSPADVHVVFLDSPASPLGSATDLDPISDCPMPSSSWSASTTVNDGSVLPQSWSPANTARECVGPRTPPGSPPDSPNGPEWSPADSDGPRSPWSPSDSFYDCALSPPGVSPADKDGPVSPPRSPTDPAYDCTRSPPVLSSTDTVRNGHVPSTSWCTDDVITYPSRSPASPSSSGAHLVSADRPAAPTTRSPNDNDTVNKYAPLSQSSYAADPDPLTKRLRAPSVAYFGLDDLDSTDKRRMQEVRSEGSLSDVTDTESGDVSDRGE